MQSTQNKNIDMSEDYKREIERAFSILEAYGVHRERSGSVYNGIDVLITRMRKELICKDYEIFKLKKDVVKLQKCLNLVS